MNTKFSDLKNHINQQKEQLRNEILTTIVNSDEKIKEVYINLDSGFVIINIKKGKSIHRHDVEKLEDIGLRLRTIDFKDNSLHYEFAENKGEI